MNLTKKEKELLLEMAKQAILNHLGGVRKESSEPEEKGGAISRYMGVFVSVYVKRKLRGCIGTFEESKPLYINVQEIARAAAFSDGRFEPVKSKETDHLEIEISVLTPRKRIYSPGEIEIGKHGIYIISGQNRGTLLPQVADRNRWNSLQFIEYCAANKAGIGKDDWRSAELYTFEALVFRG